MILLVIPGESAHIFMPEAGRRDLVPCVLNSTQSRLEDTRHGTRDRESRLESELPQQGQHEIRSFVQAELGRRRLEIRCGQIVWTRCDTEIDGNRRADPVCVRPDTL